LTEFIDESGKPRSDDDIKEAIAEVGRAMIQMTGEPRLLILFPTIIESLKELLTLRELVRAAKRKAAGL